MYSWVGLSLGATHIYGELRGYDKDGNIKIVKLMALMSSAQAIRMNKKQRWDFPGRKYFANHKHGDETDCFETEEDVIARAKHVWKTHFPHGELLLNNEDDSVLYRMIEQEGER